jgi:hypothetical protein
MNPDTRPDDEHVSHAALKTRVAGIVTTAVVVSLILAPEALALISPNHNETVLVLN